MLVEKQNSDLMAHTQSGCNRRSYRQSRDSKQMAYDDSSGASGQAFSAARSEPVVMMHCTRVVFTDRVTNAPATSSPIPQPERVGWALNVSFSRPLPSSDCSCKLMGVGCPCLRRRPSGPS